MSYGIQYHLINDLSTEPVDLTFFKDHARIDFNMDDTLVTEYVKAARIELEKWAQLSFGVKTYRLTALKLPNHYRLVYGPVDTINTTDYNLLGDTVSSLDGRDLSDVDFQFTTKGIVNETIKIAICRYAAGLYANRFDVLTDEKGNPVNGQNIINEAKGMIKPFANITLL